MQEDLTDFARLVEAIGPWLDRLVIVGGWAHRLHRLDRRAIVPPYPALRTRDADLAFSPDAPPTGDLLSALTAAGFQEHLSGEHAPPVTYYQLGEEADGGFYTEFLTALHGGGVRRSGASDATVAHAGITAQKLRHLQVLLAAPWIIAITQDVGFPIARAVEVLVPNPVSFMVQKLLIHKYRHGNKRAQDVLYIHDTLELFGSSLEDLRTLWIDQVHPTLPAKTVATMVATHQRLFREVSDTLREAAAIVPDRRLPAETLRATCAYGLEAVLGEQNT